MAQPFLAMVIPVGGGPVDPGYGQVPGYGGGHPSHGLPGAPVYPSHGLPGAPARPDQGLPWYPGRPDQGLPGFPGRPDQGLPWYPGRPDQGLPPVYPSGQPLPPPLGPIGPIGGGGAHPEHPIVAPSPPGSTKPPPDAVWPPLAPPGSPSKPALILVWVIGMGYRWIHAEVPDQSLPPTAGTKPVEPAEPAPTPTGLRR